MSLLTVFLTLMTLFGLAGVVPNDYSYTVQFAAFGIIGLFIIKSILQIIKFNKLTMISEWLLLYIGLFIFGYINNQYIMVLSLTNIVNIMYGFLIGIQIVLLKPFKYIKLTSTLIYYIRLFLVILLVTIDLIIYNPIERISIPMWIILGILVYIISAINIDFFIRLNNLIKYLFKIDIKEVEREQRNQTINVLLKEISPIWTRNKAVIQLQSLANNTWLNNIPQVKEKEWFFNNTDILYFWNHNINNRAFAPVFKDAVAEFLTFLDNYGDCPSVVKEQSKSFGKYGYADEQTTFDTVYKQTLREHTLQVCELVISSDDKALSGNNREKMILTALGHDIGKAASFKDIKGYKTGDHPGTSIMLIETRFEYFDKLDYAEEVSRMIKNHHGTPSASTPLLQLFQEYDSKARRLYLKEYFKEQELEQQKKQEQINNKISDNNGTMTSTQMSDSAELSNTIQAAVDNTATTGFIPDFAASFSPAPETTEKTETVKNTDKVVDIQADSCGKVENNNEDLERLSVNDALYRDISTQKEESPDYYKISSFFNINEFLKTVSKHINIIDKGRFSYFTVNGDMVLCYTSSVIIEIKKAARLNKEVKVNLFNIKDNELGMSFTEYCRKLGILHTDWIQEGYYQGNFALTDIDGNTVKTGRYIPLRIDAFKEYGDYAEFEERKKGELEKIVNARVATLDEMKR